jgi:hypothetical protein
MSGADKAGRKAAARPSTAAPKAISSASVPQDRTDLEYFLSLMDKEAKLLQQLEQTAAPEGDTNPAGQDTWEEC